MRPNVAIRASFALAALAALVALTACASNPPSAVLYLAIEGHGQVAVTRTKNADSCQGNSCPTSSATDGGAIEIPYATGSQVTLTAEPATGWQFQSWAISMSGSASQTASTNPVLDITSAGTGLSILAKFDAADAGQGDANEANEGGGGAGSDSGARD